MAFQPGQVIGDHQVIESIGSGGMGEVYKVRNTLSGRIEAAKVLHAGLEGHAEVVDRFLREIRVLAALSHPNIAPLLTAYRFEGGVVMVMEHVDGVSLRELLDKGPLPAETAVRFAAQVLDALSYAHGKGVVHRDIKPANIMLTREGQIKLMDFGIARGPQEAHLTRTGMTVGSAFYMSPEQIENKDVDARSDIYALGVTLYELVTGVRPFLGDSEFSIMSAHLAASPRPPIEVDPRIPAMLNQVILMAIQKDPAQRFQTAEAMRRALGAIAGPAQPAPVPAPQPVQAKPVPPPMPAAAPPVAAPPPQHSSKRALYIVAGSLATLAALGVTAWQLPRWMSTQASQPAQTAPPAQTDTPPPNPAPALTNPEPAPTPAPTATQPVTQPLPTEQPRRTEPSPSRRPDLASTIPQNPPSAQPAAPSPTPAQPDSSPAPAPRAAAQPPAQAPAPDNSAQSSEQRERMMLMSTRVGAVRETLDRLRREQAAQGLGLRRDLVEAESRLRFRLDEGEAALKRGDAAAADRQFDAAERDLGILEKALGK
ncbi:MAG: protein kinase [Bryobacteraceae bacterium]